MAELAERSAQFCRGERRRPDRKIPGRRGTHPGGDLPGPPGRHPEGQLRAGALCGASPQQPGAIELLLDAINLYLPAPEDRGQIKGINPATEEEVALEADPDGPLAAQVFKTVADPYAGRLSIFRVLLRHHDRRLHRAQRHQGRAGTFRPALPAGGQGPEGGAPAWAPGPSGRWPSSRRPSPATP